MHFKMSVLAFVIAVACFFTCPMAFAADGACAVDAACADAPDASAEVTVPDAVAQPASFVKAIVAAGSNRQWGLVGVLLMLGVIALLRKFSGWAAVKWAGKLAGRFFAFFLTDRGGTYLAFFGTALTYVAGALSLGYGFSLDVFIGAVTAGFSVVGTYVGGKRMAFPSGEDKAQAVAANAAAVGLAAVESSEAAVEQLKAGLARARAVKVAAKPAEDLK